MYRRNRPPRSSFFTTNMYGMGAAVSAIDYMASPVVAVPLAIAQDPLATPPATTPTTTAPSGPPILSFVLLGGAALVAYWMFFPKRS